MLGAATNENVTEGEGETQASRNSQSLQITGQFIAFELGDQF